MAYSTITKGKIEINFNSSETTFANLWIKEIKKIVTILTADSTNDIDNETIKFLLVYDASFLTVQNVRKTLLVCKRRATRSYKLLMESKTQDEHIKAHEYIVGAIFNKYSGTGKNWDRVTRILSIHTVKTGFNAGRYIHVVINGFKFEVLDGACNVYTVSRI